MATAETQTPGSIARAFFHAIFEVRDLSDPSRYWTEQSVDHFIAAGISVRGPEALAQWFRDLFEAGAGWELTIRNNVDDGGPQGGGRGRAARPVPGPDPPPRRPAERRKSR